MIAATGVTSERLARPSQGRAFWAWVREVLLPNKPERDSRRARTEAAAAQRSVIAPLRLAAGATAPVTEAVRASAPANVLTFPIRGEALLVKLADVLRNRVGDRGPGNEPLLLTVTRHPHTRLLIDRTAYVDCDAECGGYRAVVQVLADTTLVLATENFDTLVDFVLQYVGPPAACEEGL